MMPRSSPSVASRGGFALIAVLWLVVALAVLLSVGLKPARVAGEAAENRLGEARALWAARGCVALMQARHADGREPTVADPVALGPRAWCRVEPMEWDERVNPNRVDSLGLLRVLRDSVAVASILDWIDEDDVPRPAGAEADWYDAASRVRPRNGPFAAVAELGLVRHMERVRLEELEALFTVRGDGSVSPDRASRRVLLSISVLSPEEVDRLVAIRTGRDEFVSAENVSLALDLDPTIEEFRELTRRLSIGHYRRTVRIHGWTDVGGRTVRSRIETTLVPVNDRLAVTDLEVR